MEWGDASAIRTAPGPPTASRESPVHDVTAAPASSLEVTGAAGACRGGSSGGGVGRSAGVRASPSAQNRTRKLMPMKPAGS